MKVGNQRRASIVFVSLFIVVGIIVFGLGCASIIKSLKSTRWPVTEGVIQSAEKTYHDDSDGGGTWGADISYTYQVGNAHYEGKKVSFGQMSASSEYAQGILNRYPVGTKVTVHYSPEDPQIAILETGIHGGTWLMLGIGTAFVLFGTMFLQIIRAAGVPAEPGSARTSVTTNPDGSMSMNKPPLLMGVIFAFMGSMVAVGTSTGGSDKWIGLVAGGMFIFAGLMLIAWNRGWNRLRNVLLVLAMLLFVAIFHWIAFGPGERSGTVTTPFSIKHGVSVRTPFAIFTILMDVVFVLIGVSKWRKRINN